MTDYWLDANVYIDSANRFYPFDIAPKFWGFLDELAANGKISSPRIVYDEVERHANNNLLQWIMARKNTALFSPSDRFVQNRLTEINLYVVENYDQVEAGKFLAGADTWLIAHARQYGGRVVTFETLVGPESRKAKIPNVCKHFDVEYMDLFGMLRALGFTF